MQTGIVIGLSSHGLALCRALRRNKIKAYAIESNSSLPSVLTNSAEVIFAKNINSEELTETLILLAKRIEAVEKPVIFPTNDKMVKIIAESWDRLSTYFSLSWGESTELVLNLQSKEAIQHVCDREGLFYPKSAALSSIEEVDAVLSQFDLPVIVKPVNPMSSFKVRLITAKTELEQLFEEHSSSLPFLLQQWIQGSDEKLVYCSSFFINGIPQINFTGRKVASTPGMGQGIVMEPYDDQNLITFSKQFFRNTNYTGPASLEFKIDNSGKYWVIEPNMGRTEYCVQCSLSNGIDLVDIEHRYASNRTIGSALTQSYSHIWLDTERDVTCYLTEVKSSKSLYVRNKKPVFPYLDTSDLKPFIKAFTITSLRALKKIKKTLFFYDTEKANPKYSSQTFTNINELESAFYTLKSSETLKDLFLSYSWFELYIKYVSSGQSTEVYFLYLSDEKNQPLAILPMCTDDSKSFKKSISALSNYYSPIFDLIFDERKISRYEALRQLYILNKPFFKSFSHLEISPIYKPAAKDFASYLEGTGFKPFINRKSVNWSSHFSSFDDFKKSLSSKIKNTYKRKTKRLDADLNWSFEYINSDAGLEKALADYDHVYSNSWKKTEPSPNFISNLSLLLAQKGSIRLGIIKIEDKPVAAQIWMVRDASAYIYKLAYDQDFRFYSVGTILTYKMCEQCIINENVTTIDFLTGDDKFKTQWMTKSRDLLEVQWVNVRTLAGIIQYVRNKLSILKRFGLNRFKS